MKNLLFATLVFWSLAGNVASAEIVGSGIPSTITKIWTDGSWGGGHVLITVDTLVSGCYGYWIEPNSSGSKENTSFALSAFHMRSKLLVYGDTSSLWQGNSNPFCKLFSIQLPAL